MNKSQSKELAIPTTLMLCEGIMRMYGADRSNGQRMLYDADLELHDLDGEPLRSRLYQIGGVGLQAVYLLRTQSLYDKGESLYRFDAISGKLTQRVRKEDDIMTLSYEVTPEVLENLLRSLDK